jgi:hypothetical protein
MLPAKINFKRERKSKDAKKTCDENIHLSSEQSNVFTGLLPMLKSLP